MSAQLTAVPERVAREFKLDDYPGINRFALDLISSRGTAANFLPRASMATPSSHPNRTDLAAELRETNRRWGNDVDATLDEWKRGESLTLIAGQQVGIGGGPLYTLAKIASLLKIRDRLKAQGTRATVFFWLATEDHDWAEVSRLEWWDRDGLRRLKATESPARSFVVGPLALPESLRRSLIEVLGEEPRWLREGVTLRDSFAMLLGEVLEKREVVLVDAMLPALRRSGVTLFESVIDRFEELQSIVRERSEELRSAGYVPQVVPSDDGNYPFLFFVDGRGERHAVRRVASGWNVATDELSTSALLDRVRRAPEHVSTGVLIRPLLQDLVFGSGCFVGGPAEVAYYAQVSPLHRALNVALPWVALRGHALVGPERLVGIMERHALGPVDLFRGADALLASFEQNDIARVDAIAEAAQRQLSETLADISAIVTTADRGSAKAIRRSTEHLEYHLKKLADRSRRAVARRDAERARSIDRLTTLLAPDGTPQDRRVAWLPFYRMFGARLVDALVEAVEPDQPVVRITGL